MVVGLGNPGPKYERTRHNIGFRVLDRLADDWAAGRGREKHRAALVEARAWPGGPRVILVKPLTFMNESGKAVGPARGAAGVTLDRMVVVHDEIDLPFGEVRARKGGGLAGHNGLKSLKAGLGSTDFWRIRVGVGRPGASDPETVSAWVLGRFREPEDEVEELVVAAARATERLLEQIEAAGSGEEE